MCMIQVNIDEAELRDLRPELNSTAAISIWIQELVNLHIQQMRLEDEETISIEDARAMTLQAIREEYARP